jgi:hypothetical protein
LGPGGPYLSRFAAFSPARPCAEHSTHAAHTLSHGCSTRGARGAPLAANSAKSSQFLGSLARRAREPHLAAAHGEGILERAALATGRRALRLS